MPVAGRVGTRPLGFLAGKAGASVAGD